MQSSGTPGSTILVVDDDSNIRLVIGRLLRDKGYNVLEAVDGEACLALARQSKIDLILLDIQMPGLNGIEVVKRLKADPESQTIPVIMVTGLTDRHFRLEALEAGAEDFVGKPIDRSELWVRVRNHLRLKEYADFLFAHGRVLEERIASATAELRDAYRETVHVTTAVAEYRDDDTGAHVRRVSLFTAEIARSLGVGADFTDQIYYASPMHDLGKVAIPDSVLTKPGPFTPKEWELMKTHTTIGYEVLRSGNTPYVRMGAEIALSHHERFDGTGYPRGLVGDAIPLAGRIMNICDQYDALRARRPYKPALDHATTLRILTVGDGRTLPSHFDPEVLAAFTRSAERFREMYEANRDTPLLSIPG